MGDINDIIKTVSILYTGIQQLKEETQSQFNTNIIKFQRLENQINSLTSGLIKLRDFDTSDDRNTDDGTVAVAHPVATVANSLPHGGADAESDIADVDVGIGHLNGHDSGQDACMPTTTTARVYATAKARFLASRSTSTNANLGDSQGRTTTAISRPSLPLPVASRCPRRLIAHRSPSPPRLGAQKTISQYQAQASSAEPKSNVHAPELENEMQKGSSLSSSSSELDPDEKFFVELTSEDDDDIHSDDSHSPSVDENVNNDNQNQAQTETSTEVFPKQNQIQNCDEAVSDSEPPIKKARMNMNIMSAPQNAASSSSSSASSAADFSRTQTENPNDIAPFAPSPSPGTGVADNRDELLQAADGGLVNGTNGWKDNLTTDTVEIKEEILETMIQNDCETETEDIDVELGIAVGARSKPILVVTLDETETEENDGLQVEAVDIDGTEIKVESSETDADFEAVSIQSVDSINFPAPIIYHVKREGDDEDSIHQTNDNGEFDIENLPEDENEGEGMSEIHKIRKSRPAVKELSQTMETGTGLVASTSEAKSRSDFTSTTTASGSGSVLSTSSIPSSNSPRAPSPAPPLTQTEIISPGSSDITEVEPFAVGNFTGRTQELAKLLELFSSNGTTTTCVLISGENGIGKTQLVRKFLSTAKTRMSSSSRGLSSPSSWSSCWINCENVHTIRSSLKGFATRLEIPPESEIKEEYEHGDVMKTLRLIVDTLKGEGRKRRRWIFVLDDIKKVEDDEPIPIKGVVKILKTLSAAFLILVSGQGDDFKKDLKDRTLVHINLQTFSKSEAVEYVKSSLKVLEGNALVAPPNEDILKLANYLDCLPLGLSIALGYLNNLIFPSPISLQKLHQYLKDLGVSEALTTTTKRTETLVHNQKATQKFVTVVVHSINTILDLIIDRNVSALIKMILVALTVGDSRQLRCDFLHKFEGSGCGTGVEGALEILSKCALIQREGEHVGIQLLVQMAVREWSRQTSPVDITSARMLGKFWMDFNEDEWQSSDMEGISSLWKLSFEFFKLIPHSSKCCKILERLEDLGMFHKSMELAVWTHGEFARLKSLGLGPDHANTVEMLYWEASALMELGHETRAIKKMSEVYKRQKTLFGLGHPDTVETCFKLGIFLFNRGQYVKSNAMNYEMEAWQKIHLAENHKDALKIQHNIATTLYRQGMFEESRKVFDKVIGILEAVPATERDQQAIEDAKTGLEDTMKELNKKRNTRKGK